MRQIILGSGPLGLAIMDELSTTDSEIIIVNRKGFIDEPLPKNVSVRQADLYDSSNLKKICENGDTVYHCAMPAYTEWNSKFVNLTHSICEALEGKEITLVYADNLYMYGLQDRPMSENSPVKPNSKKGQVRGRCAELLLNLSKMSSVNVTILRGSDFFGPRVKNSSFGSIVFDSALQNKKIKLFGNPDKKHSITYIRDFAKAMIIAVNNPVNEGIVYHVPNADVTTTKEFISLVEIEVGSKLKILSAGKYILSIISIFNPMIKELKEILYQWTNDFVSDHTLFENKFNIKPTPFKQSVAETVKWYRNNQN